MSAAACTIWLDWLYAFCVREVMNGGTSLGRDADCIMLTSSLPCSRLTGLRNHRDKQASQPGSGHDWMHCMSLSATADLLLDEGLSVGQIHAQAALQLLPHHLLCGLLHRSRSAISPWGASLQSTSPSNTAWSEAAS